VARRLGGLLLLPLLAGALLLLLARGAGASVGVPVQVNPAVGGPTSTFVVSFTATASTGVIESMRVRDELRADTGSTSTSCDSRVSQLVPDVHRGQRIHVTLERRPADARWCAGVFRGKLVELQTLVCPLRSLCPDYVRIRTLGTFSFVVRRVT
jgi:hypothetical protein